MADVFTSVRVFPLALSTTLVEWDLHPQFNRPAPYNFTVEFSRTGNPTDTAWVAVTGTVTTPGAHFSLSDAKMRNWASQSQAHYRVKLDIPNGTPNETYYSYVQLASGSLDRDDLLRAREVFRQEGLLLRKRTGAKGLLFRRMTWGTRDTSTVDPDTNEILNDQSTSDYGTGYVGGYWAPFEFYMELGAGTALAVRQGQVGTSGTVKESAKCVAWPMPRSNDVWYDETSGSRYTIGRAQVVSRIRHVPIVLAVEITREPETDVIYNLQIPVTV